MKHIKYHLGVCLGANIFAVMVTGDLSSCLLFVCNESLLVEIRRYSSKRAESKCNSIITTVMGGGRYIDVKVCLIVSGKKKVKLGNRV